MSLFFVQNDEDANMRLRGTVVSYKGEPVLVENIEGFEAYGVFLQNPKEDGLPLERFGRIDSKDFCFRPLPLGYCNVPIFLEPLYIKRTPEVKFKQGIPLDRLICLRGGMEVRTNLRSKKLLPFLYSMFMRNYPEFLKAQSIAEQGDRYVAFNRRFAVGKRGKILFRGVYIGEVNKLLDNYSYLQEALEEAICCA